MYKYKYMMRHLSQPYRLAVEYSLGILGALPLVMECQAYSLMSYEGNVV